VGGRVCSQSPTAEWKVVTGEETRDSRMLVTTPGWSGRFNLCATSVGEMLILPTVHHINR
jgi:hypothetical protein